MARALSAYHGRRRAGRCVHRHRRGTDAPLLFGSACDQRPGRSWRRDGAAGIDRGLRARPSSRSIGCAFWSSSCLQRAACLLGFPLSSLSPPDCVAIAAAVLHRRCRAARPRIGSLRSDAAMFARDRRQRREMGARRHDFVHDILRFRRRADTMNGACTGRSRHFAAVTKGDRVPASRRQRMAHRSDRPRHGDGNVHTICLFWRKVLPRRTSRSSYCGSPSSEACEDHRSCRTHSCAPSSSSWRPCCSRPSARSGEAGSAGDLRHRRAPLPDDAAHGPVRADADTAYTGAKRHVDEMKVRARERQGAADGSVAIRRRACAVFSRPSDDAPLHCAGGLRPSHSSGRLAVARSRQHRRTDSIAGDRSDQSGRDARRQRRRRHLEDDEWRRGVVRS